MEGAVGVVEVEFGRLGEAAAQAEEGEGQHEAYHHAAGGYLVVLCGICGWGRLGLHGLDIGGGVGLGRSQVLLCMGIVERHGCLLLGFACVCCFHKINIAGYQLI